GANRFVWNMRYQESRKVKRGSTIEAGAPGPLAPPGAYQVRLSIGDQTYTQPFELRKDPRTPAGQADLEAQFALLLQIRDKFSATAGAINQIRHLRRQAREWARRIATRPEDQSRWSAVTEAANALRDQLIAIEEELIQVRTAEGVDAL